MTRPFVTIGVASTGSWKARMGQALAHLSYVSSAHCDFSVMIAEGSIVSCRNRLALGAIEAKSSHLLFIDSDNTFPADGLARLLTHDRDIVGASYARRNPPYSVLGEWVNNGTDLVPATKVPAGFLLIKTRVFEKIAAPWFLEPIDFSMRTEHNIIGQTSDDIYFCEQALKAGFEIWLDLSITTQMGHIGEIVATCYDQSK
jgi:hypothetical protein